MWNSHVRSPDQEKIDLTTAGNVQALIDQLNSQLVWEIMPMLDEVLAII
ncbi:hypothetical protein GO755_31445 [Spirosoma sp. HMF4905]|uniref:Uncharacterized protein n=1 Tax=Spirosoma arboris TaxID=2682092 RepID=A0A7K1SLX0_9BACT|nr:hypothetical protein [Spirosoma arboris]MVM34586.1 hypothetical protein [Spirosoma arboris]